MLNAVSWWMLRELLGAGPGDPKDLACTTPMEIEIEIKRSFQRSFQSPKSLMLTATARAAHPHRRHHHRGPGFLVFLGGSPLGYGSQGGGDRWRNGDWTDRRQEPGHGRREDRAGRCAGLR